MLGEYCRPKKREKGLENTHLGGAGGESSANEKSERILVHRGGGGIEVTSRFFLIPISVPGKVGGTLGGA